MTIYEFELHAGTASQGVVAEESIGIRGAGDFEKARQAAVNFAKDWVSTVPEMLAVPAPRNVTNYVAVHHVATREQSTDDELVQQKQAESWAAESPEEA